MDEILVYSNSRHGLGIRILGSRKMTGQQGIYVKELLAGGLAEQDGRLKVGDQILSINQQSVVGIDREEALRILRSAAQTNEVRLHVRHIHSNSSSIYYQKLFVTEEINERSSYISSLNGKRVEDERIDRLSEQLNISSIALKCLLRSNYQWSDLIDLVKKNSQISLLHNSIKEFHLIHQLTQTHSDGRITMEDFEYEFNLIFGETLDILKVFYTPTLNALSTNNRTNNYHQHSIRELRQEIFKYQARIAELEKEIVMCEKAQSLAKQIEHEYEHIIANLSDQIQQYHSNGQIYLRETNMKEEFLAKLLTYVPDYYHHHSSEQLIS